MDRNKHFLYKVHSEFAFMQCKARMALKGACEQLCQRWSCQELLVMTAISTPIFQVLPCFSVWSALETGTEPPWILSGYLLSTLHRHLHSVIIFVIVASVSCVGRSRSGKGWDQCWKGSNVCLAYALNHTLVGPQPFLCLHCKVHPLIWLFCVSSLCISLPPYMPKV